MSRHHSGGSLADFLVEIVSWIVELLIHRNLRK